MKHSTEDSTFQTNLLQALQKNKIIQDKLTECQHSRYIQLLKDMQTYNLKEKYNRELLYTWKKESYVRQLRKDLQEYEQKHAGIKDAYYEYQLRKLGDIITGQQKLPIPVSEEERRFNINVKYHKFLRKNPLQSSTIRTGNSTKIPNGQSDNDNDDDDDEEDGDDEEKNAHDLEETWKHIHAQSAVASRRKQNNFFPNIHRSSTMNEIRRKKSSAKSLIAPKITNASNILITKDSLSDNKIQQSPRSPNKSSSINLELSDSIEPLLITSEALDKHTRADLITMRSVRRPRKNPAELNLLFETRKRIYQINKRALDYQLYQRKCRLQTNLQFDIIKSIDSTTTTTNNNNNNNHVRNLIENINENIEKQNDDNNKNQSDRIII